MNSKFTKERVMAIGFKRVDASSLDEGIRSIFLRRKHAVNMRLDGYTGGEIRKLTGISESEITRLYARFTMMTEEGVLLGEAGLIPHTRIRKNVRHKLLPTKHTEAHGGLTGALGYTLAKYPGIADKFATEVFRKDFKFGHGARYEKAQLCAVFYDICRSEGVQEGEWPLNKARGARKTVLNFIKQILESDFERAALATGGPIALTHSKAGTGHSALFDNYDVYDLIEIDSYHVDAFFVLNISGDRRSQTKDVISRIWLIAAVCRRSNAVLAIKFVFSSEIRAQDLIDLICDAYRGGWQPRKTFNVFDLKYSDYAGMPGYSFPELKNHTWGAVSLDNAMQHHANQVYELALHTIGFGINYGPLKQPARRSKVEGLFKRISSKVMHPLASTTGSSPENGRAESPEEGAAYYQIDVDDALEVMDVYAANYNGVPQGGLNKANSPLEILHDYCNDSNALLPVSSEVYLSTVELGSMVRRASVTGSIEKGIRPRIKLDQALYTSPDLANSPSLIGTKLLIRINPSDYRYVEAYLEDGVYFGILTVEASWRNLVHSVTTRKLVNRALFKREFMIMEGESPVVAWQRHLRTLASPSSNRELERLKHEAKEPQMPAKSSETIKMDTPPESAITERWKKLDILK